MQSLEKRQPKAKPSQGRAKPTSPTRQLINLIMKNWDQIPHTEHRKINRLIGRQLNEQPQSPAVLIMKNWDKIHR